VNHNSAEGSTFPKPPAGEALNPLGGDKNGDKLYARLLDTTRTAAEAAVSVRDYLELRLHLGSLRSKTSPHPAERR
jgi:hypothetical protein